MNLSGNLELDNVSKLTNKISIPLIKLGFNSKDNDGNDLLFMYEISQYMQEEIIKSFHFSNVKNIIMGFPYYNEFNKENHIKLLNYLFINLSNIIKECENEDDFPYFLMKSDQFLEQLNIDDLIFICSILHNLKLRIHLMPIIQIAMKNYNITREDLITESNNKKYQMKIYAK